MEFCWAWTVTTFKTQPPLSWRSLVSPSPWVWSIVPPEARGADCIANCSYIHRRSSRLLLCLQSQNQRGERAWEGCKPTLNSSWLVPALWPWETKEFLQRAGSAKNLGILRKQEKCEALSLRRELCEDQIARDACFGFQLLQHNPIRLGCQYTT